MKIKNLKLKNFAKFTDFECEFDSRITRLVGLNGDGKTTVGLTAIWACLKGISEKSKDGQLLGERFRFIGGAKPTADIELTLLDEKKNIEVIARNHISKTGNKITFEAVKGTLPQGWLNDLLSVAFLSAKNFTQLDSREQALLLGIDTTEHDDQLKALKTRYTEINRDIKGIGSVAKLDKTERVSINELAGKLEQAQKHNQEQELKTRDISEADKSILATQKNIEDLEEQLYAQKQHLQDLKNKKDNLDEPGELIDTEPIYKAMQDAEDTNRKAEAYEANQAKVEKLKRLEKLLDANKADQEKAAKARLDYIKSFDFGFSGLEVGDDGGLLLNERPIREPYFSKGELEVIVARLYASKNPVLKVRFIDDFELLDEKNQTALLDELLERGFQVITAEVGDKAKEQNTILLRECKIADSKTGSQQKLL